MGGTTDVRSLLLEVDASVELLRRNLTRGEQAVGAFESETRQRLDRVDRRFEQLGSGLRQLSGPIARARADISSIGTSAIRVEAQVRSSSNSMRTALLSSAAAIGSAFSVKEVADYADSYTRFTNQLKVAGLEGGNLAKVQEQLFGIAQRYGVQLESVGTLYGRLSQGAKELGASQSQLLQFTSGVGAALKVQGGDAAASAGALLQLTQALGSTYVRAEEFNSVNEGARPILQAVANGIDKYKGSVAALRNDVIAGTLTSSDFFKGFLKGSAALEQQAAKANFTIGASFTILNNALGRYIGQTDASLSATARVAGGIAALANNLDTIIPALAVVGVGFATRFAVGPITTASAAVAALRAELFASNVVMLGGATAAAAKANYAAAAAATEVAGIEATIAARRAEQTVLAEQIASERALIVERQAAAQAAAVSLTQGGLNGRTAAIAAQVKAENDAAFATDRLTLARQRLALVDGELAVAEGALAGAQARSVVATEAAAVATVRATLAARAGAVASRLFAGALTLIGGSVAGGAAVLAIGALIGAFLLFRNAAISAEERNKATAASMREASEAGKILNQDLAVLANTGRNAASGIAQVGANAAVSTGKMLTFAGAVGEAAEKLRQLALERRREQVLDFAKKSVTAEVRANEAEARIRARRPNIAAGNVGSAMAITGGGGLSTADQKANAEDARLAAYWRSLQGANYRAAQTAANIPLSDRIKESDRIGGRDVDGDLARVTRDLVIARQRGIRAQVDSLEAQKFELTQYKEYRSKGLSPQAAQEAATRDASSFRDASAGAQGDRDAKARRSATSKAEREAAASARKQAAQVKDAAADERTYSIAERHANNDIAAARADLTNSAIERAQIEKDRIEAERLSRNNEIEQQAKQGGLGTGKVAEARKLELQNLNDKRAALETQVVDARERQRLADEGLAVAQAGRENETELLQKQAELVTTSRKRRDLELRILGIQYEEEKARLDGVIASRDSSEYEKQIARQKLAILGQLQASDAQAIDRKNQNPFEAYGQGLRDSVGDAEHLKETLQSITVHGLDGATDELSRSVAEALKLKGIAGQIVAEFAKMVLQKAILKIGGSFFGLASGGKVEGKAEGGRVTGPGTSTSDSILALVGGRKPIMLSNGESIVNAAATAKYWPLIDAMNKGKVRGLAEGGPVANLPSAPGLRIPTISDTSLRRASRNDRLHVTTDVNVKPSPLFQTEVERTTLRTVSATADPIMAGAEARTVKKLRRPDLPGGWG